MDRINVDSRNIVSIGYDQKTSTLEVEFYGGRIYQYFDVPNKVYEAFFHASSKGTFLSEQIKGHYRYVRV